MINKSYFDLIESISELRNFNKGESVFVQGKAAKSIYKVESGEVHLYRYSQVGKKILLYRAYKNDYFAEASLNSTHYHCTAECVKETEVRVINSDKMLDLLSHNNEFASAWIAILSSEVRRQRGNVERLNINSAEERFRHYLMTETEPLGELYLKGTISELANILGLTRETLYRVISRMEKCGDIERTDSFIKLKQK
jgi:CRP/FNR family transcriptional regulator, dissimilatory nitrate respiration regulator